MLPRTLSSSLPLTIVLASLLTLDATSLGATPLHPQPNDDLETLLCLKHHLSTNPANLLPSWNNDSIQFCTWSGVTCSKRHSSRVVALDLESLDLGGQIPPCIGNLSFITRIHLPNNQLQSQIPAEIGQLSRLQYLNLSYNNLTGNIPVTLASCFRFQAIDMASNALGGSIPEGLGTLPKLSVLTLSGNYLTGKIPESLGRSTSLVSVILNNNSLTGPIPSLLANSSSLQVLALRKNHLSGTIPSTFGNFTSLLYLTLQGEIPTNIGYNLPRITTLIMQGNNFQGQIPTTLANTTNLQVINLQANTFRGIIPSFGTLPNLIQLDLGMNMLEAGDCFNGSIPKHILTLSSLAEGECVRLESLHLESNLLNGRIPESLISLRGLIEMDLSQNNLSVIFKKRNKVKQTDYPSIKDLKNFSYADLVKATNCFSSANLVGSGKYGSVYKGRLWCEEYTVAIKVFKLAQLGASESFLAECEALKNTRHRNLVKVITACSTFDSTGHEFKALILEYMPNGSLESWLYPNLNKYGLKTTLSFDSRITIAMDIASALDYLHNHCMPPVVHCDLKPSNVLLDDAMGASLADFGLAKFVHSSMRSFHHSSTSLLGPRGSIGYIAPEYGFGSKPSIEGDVYSYGIIILEMLTGKRPTDEMFTNGLNLHKFVEKSFPEKIAEVLDPCLVSSLEDADMDDNLDYKHDGTTGVKSCIMHLFKLGLSCSVETPKDRPNMHDVYAEVITIKEAGTCSRSGPRTAPAVVTAGAGHDCTAPAAITAGAGHDCTAPTETTAGAVHATNRFGCGLKNKKNTAPSLRATAARSPPRPRHALPPAAAAPSRAPSPRAAAACHRCVVALAVAARCHPSSRAPDLPSSRTRCRRVLPPPPTVAVRASTCRTRRRCVPPPAAAAPSRLPSPLAATRRRCVARWTRRRALAPLLPRRPCRPHAVKPREPRLLAGRGREEGS
ncbi:hypothetical protein U9M48_042034 [Paspalum notatum var. saurae]|uniref:Receptor kinase-like protein Xa21 n=1 Tax=Paspalum notatum var. saurae TaxID=547442 RepID=A0AAQ3UQ28_PASNO